MWDVGPKNLISISAYCSLSRALKRGPRAVAEGLPRTARPGSRCRVACSNKNPKMALSEMMPGEVSLRIPQPSGPGAWQSRFQPWAFCSSALAESADRPISWTNRADRRPPCRSWKSLAIVWPNDIIGNFTALVAGVAQLAEHRFCKPKVVSSTLTASSVARGRRRSPSAPEHRLDRDTTRRRATARPKTGGYPSGQRGQTVNLVALPSQVRILLHPCWLPQHGRSIGPTGRSSSG